MKNNVIKINNKIAATSSTSVSSLYAQRNSPNYKNESEENLVSKIFVEKHDEFLITNSCNLEDLHSSVLMLNNDYKSDSDSPKTNLLSNQNSTSKIQVNITQLFSIYIWLNVYYSVD